MSKTKRILGQFTNQFGQTFNPGDKVIAVTVCTGRTNIARAEYVGYVEREEGNWPNPGTTTKKYVQIRRPSTTSVAVYGGTTIKVNWATFIRGKDEAEWITVEKPIVTTLWYNNILADDSSVDSLIEAV